jgi:hypothetical protein
MQVSSSPTVKPGDTVLIRTSDGDVMTGVFVAELDKPLSCVIKIGPDGRTCQFNGSYVVRREVLSRDVS